MLDFDPSSISDYRDIVELCKVRRLSQCGAVLEWARSNPGNVPVFIHQMKNNLEFRGWFKPYYDVLRQMFRRVLQEDALEIDELDKEFELNFWRQKEVEDTKLLNVALELKEFQSRVDWFEDAIKHEEMLDCARLLHRLPQLSVKRSVKRGRSRSHTGPRRIPSPSVAKSKSHVISNCLMQRIQVRESRTSSSSPGRDTPPRRIRLINSEGDDLLPEDNFDGESTIHTGKIFPVSIRRDDDCNAVIATDNVSVQFVVNVNPIEQEIAGPSGVESKENDDSTTSVPDEPSSIGRIPDVTLHQEGSYENVHLECLSQEKVFPELVQ